MRKLSFITAVTVVALFCVAAMPAGAVPIGALQFKGTATLNGTPTPFPCTGPTCTGTFLATGNGRAVDSVTHAVSTCANCKITATYTYAEPGGKCVAGKVPLAATGTANGSITTYFTPTAVTSHFAWTRVGVTAIVLLSNPTGVSVAGFIPPSTCKIKTATVAGIAIFA
jgi:hypothetical protein